MTLAELEGYVEKEMKVLDQELGKKTPTLYKSMIEAFLKQLNDQLPAYVSTLNFSDVEYDTETKRMTANFKFPEIQGKHGPLEAEGVPRCQVSDLARALFDSCPDVLEYVRSRAEPGRCDPAAFAKTADTCWRIDDKGFRSKWTARAEVVVLALVK